MKNFAEWRSSQNVGSLAEVRLAREDFLRICLEYFGSALRGDMKTIHEFRKENLVEAVETSRYAIDVNYRTTGEEALEGFAKICLGYISAAMKGHGFHTKHVFTKLGVTSRRAAVARARERGLLAPDAR